VTLNLVDDIYLYIFFVLHLFVNNFFFMRLNIIILLFVPLIEMSLKSLMKAYKRCVLTSSSKISILKSLCKIRLELYIVDH